MFFYISSVDENYSIRQGYSLAVTKLEHYTK
jgi:hypothetical protein